MTVRELIEELQKLPQDLRVVIDDAGVAEDPSPALAWIDEYETVYLTKPTERGVLDAGVEEAVSL